MSMKDDTSSVEGHAEEPETVEIEALEADPERERIEFELMLTPDREGGATVRIKPDFKHPVELRFGRTPETSPCFLVHGSECPQLGAEFILVQPDVIAKDPRKGWEPIGGLRVDRIAYIGRGEESPQLRLGPDVSRLHAEVEYRREPYNYIEVATHQNQGRRYVRISAHPEDLAELPSGMRPVS
jgi:hypothetical protein